MYGALRSNGIGNNTERVTFELKDDGNCVPLISNSNNGDTRAFTGEDMAHVLDFASATEDTSANLGASGGDMEEDAIMWMCTRDDSAKSGLAFPKRVISLRGGFLFYFNHQAESKEATRQPPLGVIPLHSVVVENPPGGRRVFREHADSSPRNGYAFCLRHKIQNKSKKDPFGPDSEGEKQNSDADGLLLEPRPNYYLVAETLGQREAWAKAIRVRVEACENNDTKLRPSSSAGHSNVPGQFLSSPFHNPANFDDHLNYSPAYLFQRHTENHHEDDENNPFSYITVSPEEEEDIQEALDKFGGQRKNALSENMGAANSHRAHDDDEPSLFDENEWVDDYFQKHDDFDAPAICRTLDKWQVAVKKGLRGAVLEQYEYFVDASRVMTTMGREVANLRNLTELQLQTIQTMKEIDFASALNDVGSSGYNGHNGSADDDSLMIMSYDEDDDDEDYSTDEEEEENNYYNAEEDEEGDEIALSDGYQNGRSNHTPQRPGLLRGSVLNKAAVKDSQVEFLEIPEWLDDVAEEISAFIKECRYTDATELLLKARNEVNEIFNQHEKITEKILSKKQQATLSRMLQSFGMLSNRMGNRLVEGLRRKNEALKQAAKRERADPLYILAPLISPICLNDDASALQLLVKLGRHQDAATAYAARRSLLLMESLHERPIASATTASNNNADVVIYAAQLSQSFFSCLAMAVEGFLDLFMEKSLSHQRDELMEEMGSINTTLVGRNVPAGALSAIVLWCDSEMAKFAIAFGSSRVIGNLALTPKDAYNNNHKNISKALSKAVSKFEKIGALAQQKNQLRVAEENGEFQVAAMLRRKIAQTQNDQKDGNVTEIATKSEIVRIDKERQNAIDIAAKCIDQAFQFASENLDSIGLPMISRLSECIRPRLKGCESEIADLLDYKWRHVTYDWKEVVPTEDSNLPELRRTRRDLQPSFSNE